MSRTDKRALVIPSDAEDAEITAAAMQDEDNLPLTPDELSKFKRLSKKKDKDSREAER